MGVVGVGGLGHLALQFAHAFGCEVTAVSSSPDKEQEARAFGADDFVAAPDEADMRRIEYAFDLLLCSTHGGVDWESLLMAVKKRGRIVLLGFPDLHMDPTDLVAHELSLTGSFLGNRTGMREMLGFAEEKRIRPQVELMPMSQVNEAISRVRQNQARYRIVLVNEARA